MDNSTSTTPGLQAETLDDLNAELAATVNDDSPDAEPADVDNDKMHVHYHTTDLGNGQRLAKRHRTDLRYSHPWKKWLIWDRKRWKLDDVGGIASRAKATVRGIYTEAAKCEDDGIRKALVEHARKSEKRASIAAMIDMARSEAGIPILPDLLDKNPWLLNCKNGTIDLQTGELQKHSQADYITKICPTAFHPKAGCPRWLKFLDQIFAGDEDLIRFLQRLAGYCLTGSTADHILPVFWGKGSNGKSTFIGALMDVMGPDFAMKAPRDMLMIRRGEHHPTELTDLFGKRFVAAVETAEGQRLDEALIKELTGGDPIRARRMKEDYWQFAPTHKLLLCTNHAPDIRDTTHSTWRRVKLVPFNVVIVDAEQDRDLPRKLKAEVAGILAWAVEGCLAWQDGGLAEPEAVKLATSAYRSEQDLIGVFLADCCTVETAAAIRSKDLYEAYQKWGEETGEKPVGTRRFGRTMTERGFDRFKNNGTWYRGLDIVAGGDLAQ